MKITFYGYNTFVIETGEKKIAIDPGGLFLYYFRMTTLIPKSEWEDITHIFVTHGDPDHYWHMDRVAKASNAPVICNRTMAREVNGKQLMLGPRDKGLAFTTEIPKLHTLSVDETIEVDGVKATGLKATHGPLMIKCGPVSKLVEPGPEERIGWGAVGFRIEVDGKMLVNLGDTILHLKEWRNVKNPDVLMVPIGGTVARNTMDEQEALRVVREMKPRSVIPCHYNCPALFSKRANPADDLWFKKEADSAGSECTLLQAGEEVII